MILAKRLIPWLEHRRCRSHWVLCVLLVALMVAMAGGGGRVAATASGPGQPLSGDRELTVVSGCAGSVLAISEGESLESGAAVHHPEDPTPGNSASSVTVNGHEIFLPLVVRRWGVVRLALYPTDDAPVMQGQPSLSLGADASRLMGVGYETAECALLREQDPLDPYRISRALVRFDVSSIPVAAVHSAVLHFREVAYCGYDTASDMTVTAHRLLGPWSEDTVNWDAAPAFAEAHGSTVVDWDNLEEPWHQIDITELVNVWLGGSSNHGLMLRGYEASGDDDPDAMIVGFAQTGSEVDGEPAGPFLEVIYYGPAP